MKDLTPVAKEIIRFIEEYHRLDRDFILGAAAGRDMPVRLPEELLGFALASREEIVELLGRGGEAGRPVEVLVDVLSERTCRFITDVNQYVRITPAERRRLGELFESLLAGVGLMLGGCGEAAECRRAAHDLIAGHIALLSSLLASLEDAPLLAAAMEDGGGRPIPCREYTPQHQLAILGISCDCLFEPVLDVGCGEHGLLVRHLREADIDAAGIDRYVLPSPHLSAGDWLEEVFQKERWGTVISHMSFSNHFIHHHLRRDGRYRDYARKYVEILESLKPGGAFYYAPGLPFMEELLPPDRFEASLLKIEIDIGGRDYLHGEDCGIDTCYAARIFRVS